MSNFAHILNDRFSIVAATRDDEYIAQVISTTKTMDSVHNLEDEAQEKVLFFMPFYCIPSFSHLPDE